MTAIPYSLSGIFMILVHSHTPTSIPIPTRQSSGIAGGEGKSRGWDGTELEVEVGVGKEGFWGPEHVIKTYKVQKNASFYSRVNILCEGRRGGGRRGDTVRGSSCNAAL